MDMRYPAHASELVPQRPGPRLLRQVPEPRPGKAPGSAAMQKELEKGHQSEILDPFGSGVPRVATAGYADRISMMEECDGGWWRRRRAAVFGDLWSEGSAPVAGRGQAADRGGLRPPQRAHPAATVADFLTAVLTPGSGPGRRPKAALCEHISIFYNRSRRHLSTAPRGRAQPRAGVAAPVPSREDRAQGSRASFQQLLPQLVRKAWSPPRIPCFKAADGSCSAGTPGEGVGHSGPGPQGTTPVPEQRKPIPAPFRCDDRRCTRCRGRLEGFR